MLKQKLRNKILISVAAISLITSIFQKAQAQQNDLLLVSDAVVCKDVSGHIQSIELLDTYEGRLRGIQFEMGPASLSMQEKIELALSRLSRLSPSRAHIYRQRVQSFVAESLFLRNIQLTPSANPQAFALPQSCELVGVTSQKPPQFIENKRYTINQDLWDNLNSDQRAVAILNNIILRDFSDLGDVRYFNSYLTSAKFESMTDSDYISFLNAAHSNHRDLDVISYQSLFVALQGITRDSQGRIVSGFATSFNGQPSRIKVGSENIVVMGELSFYENGHLKSAWSAGVLTTPNCSGSECRVGETTLLLGQTVQVSPLSPVVFYESGRIKTVSVSTTQVFRFGPHNLTLGTGASGSNSTLDFAPDGSLVGCRNCLGEVQFRGQRFSTSLSLLSQSGIQFYPSGQLQAFGVGYIAHVNIQGQQVQFSGNVVAHENETVASIVIDVPISFHVRGQSVRFMHRELVEFYADETVKSGVLAAPTILEKTDGTFYLFPVGRGARIQFDSQGRVL